MRKYLDDLKARGRSERTIKDVSAAIERYLCDWLSRPLAGLTPQECYERHRKITRENGPYAANRTMRYLSAIHKAARKVYDLPDLTTLCGKDKVSIEEPVKPTP